MVVGCRDVHYSTGGGELSIVVCGSHMSAERIAQPGSNCFNLPDLRSLLQYVVS